MATENNATGSLVSMEDVKSDADSVSRWQQELDAAARELEKFHRQGDKVVKQYRDDRGDGVQQDDDETVRVNLFWSNCQVLQSSLYTRPPKVDVSRRFKDFNDDVARVAGEMIERMLNTDLETDDSDFDVSVRQSIQDWIIVGLGQIWYRYDVTMGSVEVPAPVDPITGQPIGAPQVEEQILDEDAASDYVYWKDFLWSPARVWQEVRWVARRVYMSRDQMVERFGAIGKMVPLLAPKSRGAGRNERGLAKNDPWQRAEIWEIWDKQSRKVYWVAKDFDQFLDRKPDPLKLTNFFPCPKPALANITTTSTVPRADFVMAQDQYKQCNTLATRINMLVRACKVVGVYDRANEGVQRMFSQAVENQLIPVDRWAAFAEKGGLKGTIDWMPIEAVANVIGQLRQDYADQKQELYEVLGIADIMRGASQPDETATAQSIKAQFGTSRINFKQYELATFVRDAQRIKAEIICRHFQPETIVKRSNILNTPDAKYVGPALEMIKNAEMEVYRLNIEADSMAAVDWASERDAKGQFLQAVGGYLQQMAPLAQSMPQSLPYLLQLLQFGMSGYRISAGIESVLDQAISAAQQPAPPAEPPPEKVAEVEDKKAAAELKRAQAQKALAEAQAVQPKTMSDAQHKQAQANAENTWAQTQKVSTMIKASEHLMPETPDEVGEREEPEEPGEVEGPGPDESLLHEQAEGEMPPQNVEPGR